MLNKKQHFGQAAPLHIPLKVAASRPVETSPPEPVEEKEASVSDEQVTTPPVQQPVIKPQSQAGRYRLGRPEDADAVVIHCSDPRFQAAIRDFVANELGIENPIPIIVPGGIHDFVSPIRLKAARQLWEQLEFMLKRSAVRKVILLNHDDCQWYGKWNALVQTTIGKDIAGHLLAVGEKLAEKKFKVEVECYLAKIEADEIVFCRVDRKND